MCKYCEKYSNDNYLACGEIDVIITANNKLSISCGFHFEEYKTKLIPINYCPICGKKLK